MIEIADKYVAELKTYLTVLDPTELGDVCEFYEEYLLDADFNSRQEIEKELGTPRQLARKILAEHSLSPDSTPILENPHKQAKTKRDLWAIWWILLGLGAIPVGIPLFIVIFVFLLLIFIFIGVVIIVSVALLLSFIAVLVFAIPVIFSANWAVGLFYCGIALMGITFVLMFEPLDFFFIRWLIGTTAKLIRKLGRKVFKKRDSYKGDR
ncbi:DUF1700 domain-containing protein [Xylocopilactobacillus apicola]|uniref:Membrane protein n=1 Tax=Xylocopilactobacillus apicola TaxID=2932184 RepID=A0AAU9DL56_9LACO|nr:DUF1700 domain-containing protein [Xylocopilactobacillus apicola]BDR59281.1 membrane protein [Xylocopilactobacillus apicola]